MNTKIIILILASVIGIGSGVYAFDSYKKTKLETEQKEALKRVLNQGNGKIRKDGESGFLKF